MLWGYKVNINWYTLKPTYNLLKLTEFKKQSHFKLLPITSTVDPNPRGINKHAHFGQTLIIKKNKVYSTINISANSHMKEHECLEITSVIVC